MSNNYEYSFDRMKRANNTDSGVDRDYFEFFVAATEAKIEQAARKGEQILDLAEWDAAHPGGLAAVTDLEAFLRVMATNLDLLASHYLLDAASKTFEALHDKAEKARKRIADRMRLCRIGA